MRVWRRRISIKSVVQFRQVSKMLQNILIACEQMKKQQVVLFGTDILQNILLTSDTP
jgi:hypothetical protein